MVEILIVSALVAAAIGIGVIAWAVTKGFNEHVKAMQAIYDEIKKSK